jgi:hypothetical protein
MKLSKLDAAQQQLDVAASLFSNRDSRLALHTLAGAAEEILGKLLERAEQENIFQQMKASAEQRFGRSVTSSELSEIVNKSRNSLKHANDPNEDSFEYEPDEAVVMLFRALVNYQLLTGGLTDPMEKALVVLRKEYPNLIPNGTKWSIVKLIRQMCCAELRR